MKYRMWSIAGFLFFLAISVTSFAYGRWVEGIFLSTASLYALNAAINVDDEDYKW